MFSEDEWSHWNSLQPGDKRLTIAQFKTKWQAKVQDKNDGKKVMSDCKDGTLRFWIKTDDQIVFSNKSVKRRFVEAQGQQIKGADDADIERLRGFDVFTHGKDGKNSGDEMSLFNWAVASKTVQVQMEKCQLCSCRLTVCGQRRVVLDSNEVLKVMHNEMHGSEVKNDSSIFINFLFFVSNFLGIGEGMSSL